MSKDFTAGMWKFFNDVFSAKKLFALYFVPAFLYSISNNLTYTNLSRNDPTTFYLLLQLRVVVTGVMFQLLFKKELSRLQWVSLLLLTLGCGIKELGRRAQNAPLSDEVDHLTMFINTLLILLQVLCSCFASVYCEFLLKKEAPTVPLMLQNTFMHFNSLVSNLGFLCVRQELTEAFSGENLQGLLKLTVAAVVINNASIGLITSFFVKKLNSLIKVYACALQLLMTAYLSWMFFDIAVDFYTSISLMLVIIATYIFTMNPLAPSIGSTSVRLPHTIEPLDKTMQSTLGSMIRKVYG
eukprot:comp22273_c3_seq1/m.32946 comp22273_c3_seq1/g.32946  ORF comp22273_c3_seq1/g.32946 comp22273_c3_seq1/m.32946 type:complete len:297 (-) comp22273_c3_seq1:537-1427(-)